MVLMVYTSWDLGEHARDRALKSPPRVNCVILCVRSIETDTPISGIHANTDDNYVPWNQFQKNKMAHMWSRRQSVYMFTNDVTWRGFCFRGL